MRAQGQLKQVMLGMLAQVFPWPEVAVTHAGGKIANGRVSDASTREHLERFVTAFAAWALAIPPLGR